MCGFLQQGEGLVNELGLMAMLTAILMTCRPMSSQVEKLYRRLKTQIVDFLLK